MTATPSSKVDYSSLALVKATKEQAVQSGINIFPHWCAPRGMTSYESLAWLNEQLYNPAYPWTAELQSWVLVPRHNPTTTDILAHCDTLRRSGVVRTPDGTQRDVVAYNVGWVFTPLDHRRKGYARHMLRLLHYVLAPLDTLPPFPPEWGTMPEQRFGDAAFSTLFSDVGDQFYAACTKGLTEPGWVSPRDRAPIRVRKLDITEQDRLPPPDWVWLDDTNVIPLEEQVSASLRRDVGLFGDPKRVRVFCPPENGCLRMAPIRERLYSQAADIVVPHHVLGIQLPGRPGDDDPPFFTFSTRDYEGKARRIVIDFMYKPEQIPFAAVRSAAAKVEATHVKLWDGFDGWDKELPGQPTLQWEKLIPALAQYGLTDNDADMQWLWCLHYLC